MVSIDLKDKRNETPLTQIKENKMKKTILIILPLLLIFGCSRNPSLCDCIKKPYNEVKDYQTHCDNLIKKQFGTKSPSTSQMVSYTNSSCGGM